MIFLRCILHIHGYTYVSHYKFHASNYISCFSQKCERIISYTQMCFTQTKMPKSKTDLKKLRRFYGHNYILLPGGPSLYFLTILSKLHSLYFHLHLLLWYGVSSLCQLQEKLVNEPYFKVKLQNLNSHTHTYFHQFDALFSLCHLLFFWTCTSLWKGIPTI